MKIKVTYIVFQINKALGFEWALEHINPEKFEFSVISVGVEKNTPFESFCTKRNIPFHLVPYITKKDMPKAIFHTYKILRQIKPDIIHCHIFEGGLIGLIAAKMAGIKQRIYTRHYSTFHHTYAPSGRKYDVWLINKLATRIIAISKNVENVLRYKENVPAKKIVLIHHGFDLNLFYNISEERIRTVQQKYNPHQKRPVIGIISRYTEWKGIQYTIPAFKRLLEKYPDAFLILANTKGEYAAEIKNLLAELPKNNYTEIMFEPDNAALFKLFDVFVHVPVDKEIEAFGQIYIEALAAGIPSVFSLSGIATEFIEHKKNAFVVDFCNSEQVYTAILELVENEKSRTDITFKAKIDLEKYFSLSLMIKQLEELYTVSLSKTSNL